MLSYLIFDLRGQACLKSSKEHICKEVSDEVDFLHADKH